MKYDTVTVCFIDPAIQALFTELLTARGVKTHILHEIPFGFSNTKIITEPYFLPDIPKAALTKCLIVGNAQHTRESAAESEAIYLSRPLTESKVEHALAQFLTR